MSDLEATVCDVKPDLILITESWCNSNVSDNVLKLCNYDLNCELRKDRNDTSNGIGGGLLVYARKGLVILPCDKTSNFNQYVSFNVMTDNEKLTIFLIYRPPSSNYDNLNELCNLVKNAPKNAVFIGDFNLPKIDWNLHTSDRFGYDFMNACFDNNFRQYVDFATHLKNNTLDLVFSNSENILLIENLGPLSSSDHVMMLVETNFGINCEKILLERLDWKNADYDTMSKDLLDIDWRDLNEMESTEMKWQCFVTKLNGIVKKNVPLCSTLGNGRPVWMNRYIKRLRQKQSRCYKKWKKTGRTEHFEEYKKVSKVFKKAVRAAKRKFEIKVSRGNGNDGKKCFNSYVKSKLNKNSNIGPILSKENKIVTDSYEMATIFNSYFTTVFTSDSSNDFIERKFNATEMEDPIITNENIFEAIDKLQLGKAPGLDSISTNILKNFKQELVYPLKVIFSHSLQTGEVPTDWKTAKVIPIFKKGAKGDTSNYRPVSLTSVVCKVLERVLRDKIVNHLSEHNLIKKSQHGFLASRSTQTNLLEFLDKLTEIIDEGGAMDIVYLDFSKAFDKISHRLTLQKLQDHGIRGKLLNWIESWLSNRKQRVSVNGKESEDLDVLSGVPQGSVLGPLLFIIYINDIDFELETLEILKKFADDTKGAKVIECDNDRKILQDCLDRLVRWGERNKMDFNIKKCKIMHCGRNNPRYEYFMGGEKLNEVEQEKDIGVTVTANLKPSQHCQEAANRARAVLGQLTRCFHYRDRNIFLRLYKQYVRPHLEFSCVAWSPWTANDIDILENVQKKAVGMISGLASRDYEERLKEVNLWTLSKRRLMFDYIQMYKLVHGIGEIDTSIEIIRDVHPRNARVTRAHSDPLNLIRKSGRLELRRNFFTLRSIDGWNSLPKEIKSATSVNSFKNVLKKWMTRDL